MPPPPRAAAGTPVVVGGGDGPLANLGVGAVRPGDGRVSIGTSGALRVAVDRPAVDPLGSRVLLRARTGLWVVGGAVNNGGVGHAVGAGLARSRPRTRPEAELLAVAAQAPPAAAGC